MNLFILILCTVLCISCQDESLQEITLNMQQHRMETDNRIVQEHILYAAPIDKRDKVQVYVYTGSVHQIEAYSKTNRVYMDNPFNKAFLFEADKKLCSKISPKMDLIVRYYIENGNHHLVEVRKKSL